MSIDLISLGSKIKFFRKNAKLTQIEFANMIGYKSSHMIVNIEKGRSMPPLKVLFKICEVLDITMDDLADDYLIAKNKFYKDMSNELYEIFEILPTLNYKDLEDYYTGLVEFINKYKT